MPESSMATTSRTRLGAAGALVAVAISWGAIPLIVRTDVPVSHLVAARIWLGAIALVLFLMATNRLRLPERHRGRLAVSGVVLTVHWAAFFLSVKHTTVAVALAVLYLGPVLAAVLAPRVLGERVGPRSKLGLALGLAGVLLVVRPGAGVTATGVIYAVIAALTLTVIMLVVKPAAEQLGGLVVASTELVVASVVLTPWAVAATRSSAEFWLEFLLVGVLFTGVAGVIYWTAMKHLPVTTVGVLMYLEPASAVLWAALFLSEIPDALAIVGVALVIAGGAMAARESTLEEAVHAPAIV